MQCFPLFSLILALGKPVIDYLSLDIEGTELEVRKCYGRCFQKNPGIAQGARIQCGNDSCGYAVQVTQRQRQPWGKIQCGV